MRIGEAARVPASATMGEHLRRRLRTHGKLAATHAPLALHGVELRWSTRIAIGAAWFESMPAQIPSAGTRLLGEVLTHAAAGVQRSEQVTAQAQAA
jgi:hypothetical protein